MPRGKPSCRLVVARRRISTAEKKFVFLFSKGKLSSSKLGLIVSWQGPAHFPTCHGSLHSFMNESDKNARMIISIAQAGLENMFFEAGQPLAPDRDGTSTIEGANREILHVAPKYGVEIRVRADHKTSFCPNQLQKNHD